jgi:GNAT superfamily N-acetyltransferase
MDEISVILRDYNPLTDEAYIYASWRNSSYYSAFNKPRGAPEIYFRKQTLKIKDILDSNPAIKIACLEHHPETIIGYSIATGSHLDWIYVKSDYRGIGVGSLLLPKNIKTVTGDLTKVGHALVHKKNLTIGESNGRTNTQSHNETQTQSHNV